MYIIHVVPAVTKESSGPSYSVVRLCHSLIILGQIVQLSALKMGQMPTPPDFLRTFRLGLGPTRLGRSPEMRRWLSEQVQTNEIDFLHSHGMWQMNAVYPGWAVKKGRTKLVVSPRGAFSEWAMQYGSALKKVFWPLLQRPALRQASCFHATAESEYKDIRRLGFLQPVAIIPNGIDIPPLLPKKHGALRTLMFLGRIHPVKGLDMLLPAWGKIQSLFPNWRLVIAGSDIDYYGKSGYLKLLYRLIDKLELERVEFIGELHGAAKHKAYREADLFVLPSYSENFGVTVAEALASGTPAIVSKGAPWEGLEEHRAGWWIELGVPSLVSCLEGALSRSPADLEAMGLRGRRWMESEFSWEFVGKQMVDTYQWLLDKSLPVPTCVREQ